MREIYEAAMPALGFIADVLLLALAVLSALGILARATAESIETKDLVDLALLVLLFSAAVNGWIR